MHIAFFGSSLLSSYWNGAATYYRGILAALARRGHRITFYEPDAFSRQEHRDMEPPDWAEVVVYPATAESAVAQVRRAACADVLVKASGVGVFDDLLVETIIAAASPTTIPIFWDVDAPATLASLEAAPDHPLRRALPAFDAVFTYGGGQPVVDRYTALGARACHTIYNAVDPITHHPVARDPRFEADLAFLGHRLPDRERRVEAFFLEPAARMAGRRFLLGGCGWETRELPPSVRWIGHVYTADHNAFNVTPRAVLNIARDSMAEVGFSPATRVFEAAGAGACLITDAWTGIEQFFEPGREILVARDGQDVRQLVEELTKERAAAIGQAALARVLAYHTYEHRAAQAGRILSDFRSRRIAAGERLAVA